MIRGKRPIAAIRDAKKIAEKMDYRWQENTDNPDLAYDLPGLQIRLRISRQSSGKQMDLPKSCFLIRDSCMRHPRQ
jgi:hypothetical protein